MPFIRVKSASKSDPQHEFDVSTIELDANPDLYEVVDKEPVDEPREPRYLSPRAKPVDEPDEKSKK